MQKEITVTVPVWMFDKLALIAKLCGKSINHVSSAFFAAEVVHTRPATKPISCP